MKKTLALVLSLCMIFALVAGCGSSVSSDTIDEIANVVDDMNNTLNDLVADEQADAEEPAAAETTDVTDPDAIEDSITSDDGVYEVAFVTDVGQLKDKSFNQGTWNGVKLYAAANGLSYKYYQPANGDEATDDDRYDAMKAAVDAGAKIVVCAGYLQETALTRAAEDFPDTMFVFIDGYPLSDSEGNTLQNVAGIAFQEHQSGYFAGYAAVMEGFTKLGFCGGGGGTNPACCRYGYGFVQGAAAAAEALGVSVEVNYSWLYGSSFQASPELQTMANGWYENGTQVIFACGGSMFASIVAAAAENDAYVIGVDVDQSYESDTVVTSALKGLSEAATWAITKFYDGEWSDIGGTATSLGANDDSVGLPTDTWSLENYSVADYEAAMEAVKAGELVIDSDYPEDMTTLNSDYITINVVE
jgi:basic membrane protein A